MENSMMDADTARRMCWAPSQSTGDVDSALLTSRIRKARLYWERRLDEAMRPCVAVVVSGRSGSASGQPANAAALENPCWAPA